MTDFATLYENFFQKVIDQDEAPLEECYTSRKTSYGIAQAAKAWLKTNQLTQEQAVRFAAYMKRVHPVVRMELWKSLNHRVENLFKVHQHVEALMHQTADLSEDKDEYRLLNEYMHLGFSKPCPLPATEEQRNRWLKHWLMFNGFINPE